MPTICLDCRYIKPLPSGIANVVRALVDHLPALAPDWHFKLLRHSSYDRALSDAANVTEIEVGAQPNGPASMWFLPKLVDLTDVDLFHAPSNILPYGLTMPSVTTIHDIMWLTAPDLCNASLSNQVERRFFQNGINRAFAQSDAIVAVSEATRQAILQERPDLSAKVTTCLSGVSTDYRPREVDPSDVRAFGLSDRSFVLTIGQNAPYKNHEGAIRAFAEAFDDSRKIDLVIVQRRGSGPQKLGRLARQLGIADRVHFLRPQNQEDVVKLYSGALALLHPSLCEGFGMPLAEAMACGCPVITSDRSAMPEVTGGAALLVDPDSTASIAGALRRVAENPDLAKSLRKKGLERAVELDWEVSVAKYLDVYRGVLGLS